MTVIIRHASDLGSLITDLRAKSGFSQQTLADLVGTTQSAVSRWERGHDEPRFSSLVAILRATGKRLVLEDEDDGIDRAQLRQQLAMTPVERLASVVKVSRTRSVARTK